jgi:SAM-dependent methyltransferase
MSLHPTTGTVLDTAYTHNAYPEMFPRALATVLALQGRASRLDAIDSGFDYCDLGCGNGLGCNVMAAANPQGRFTGIDLNPVHIANARRLAAEGGLSNVTFVEASFAAVAEGPSFDVIALHGVYSWVGPAQRAEIVTLLKNRLRPGGVVYVSYNLLPGWAELMPLRRLMVEQTAGLDLPSLDKAMLARDFLQRIAALDLGYFAEPGRPAGFVAKLGKDSLDYLVHEYLNADWQPHYSADVAAELAEAGLVPAGDATLAENLLPLLLPPEAQDFIAAAPTPRAARTRRDFLANRAFCRDVFVKGEALGASLDDKRFAALQGPVAPGEVPMPIGPVPLSEAARASVAACAAAPQLGREIADLPLLLAAGLVEPATLDALPATEGIEQAEAIALSPFNRAVCRAAFAGQRTAYLAAPVTGATHGLGWIEAGLLLAWAEAGFAAAPHRCAEAVLAANRRLFGQGRALDGLDEHAAYLRRGLEIFRQSHLRRLVLNGAVSCPVIPA